MQTDINEFPEKSSSAVVNFKRSLIPEQPNKMIPIPTEPGPNPYSQLEREAFLTQEDKDDFNLLTAEIDDQAGQKFLLLKDSDSRSNNSSVNRREFRRNRKLRSMDR